MGYLLDFGSVTYKTLSGGYDMICYNFANHILTGPNNIYKNGGGIYLKQELINIEKGMKDYKYQLTFRKVVDEDQ